jgi:hypothetical protein
MKEMFNYKEYLVEESNLDGNIKYISQQVDWFEKEIDKVKKMNPKDVDYRGGKDGQLKDLYDIQKGLKDLLISLKKKKS